MMFFQLIASLFLILYKKSVFAAEKDAVQSNVSTKNNKLHNTQTSYLCDKNSLDYNVQYDKNNQLDCIELLSIMHKNNFVYDKKAHTFSNDIYKKKIKRSYEKNYRYEYYNPYVYSYFIARSLSISYMARKSYVLNNMKGVGVSGGCNNYLISSYIIYFDKWGVGNFRTGNKTSGMTIGLSVHKHIAMRKNFIVSYSVATYKTINNGFLAFNKSYIYQKNISNNHANITITTNNKFGRLKVLNELAFNTKKITYSIKIDV